MRLRVTRLRVPAAVALLAFAPIACAGGEGPARPPAGSAGLIRFTAPAARGSLQRISLEGAVRGSGRTAVVFAHAFPETQVSWSAFAEEMSRRGFLTLTFNFRGYGLSQGRREPASADLDLEAAVEEARRRGAATVMVVGESMGGTAAIKVAARRPLAGVVSVSAPIAFRRLDARADAARLRAPALFVAGDGDPNGAAASARTLFASAPQPKRLEIVRSRAHGADLLLDPRAGDSVSSLITSFLIEHRG